MKPEIELQTIIQPETVVFIENLVMQPESV